MKTGAKPVTGFSWPESLCAPVRGLPEHSRLWVALSGGLDSNLLLHLAVHCHGGRVPVAAIHVNHQLQLNANQTEAFCLAEGQKLGVPVVVRRVSVEKAGSTPGVGGIEEAAREARYREFEAVLEPGDLLLMAHHADDQGETVLFRLLRGTGVAGLGGMPGSRPLGNGLLVRPLLGLEREVLVDCARDAGLSWVEDPSNDDQGYDRNYLRHAIMPRLKARWPGLARRLKHTANACKESDFLNHRLAEIQLNELADESGRLSVAGLHKLSLAEQKNLLRWWIRGRGFPPPALSDWARVMGDFLEAGEDREPELRSGGYSIRRFQGMLWLVRDAVDIPSSDCWLEPGQAVEWGEWRARLESASGSNPQMPCSPIRVSTRQGGESFRPRPNGPSKRLKIWMQEQGIPPWERPRIPLFFAASGDREELIAVGDFWCSEQYSGDAPAAGWRLVVERDCD
ncbi:tRNA lysidine(34) synthetase TilS [Marinobacter salinexigens]|uniref:tRNA(Ile)-lysidine synthase n=1 Tax=Marinobacter salinexigens TaxID=2919747 RepID=A0A5B0VH63_9GAMM|nr:tRNA lysidine(34) synthetase TilS [Marinobacter salinexigens]KAA1173714.1 tRNA lysidine(34) synthetase TilS [Marinobacter salinexigens]